MSDPISAAPATRLPHNASRGAATAGRGRARGIGRGTGRAVLTEDALLTADAGTFEIFAITFDAHSELDRKRLAVREITESKVQDNGMPQDDGVMSYYLGSNNAAHLCKTCHNTGGVAGQCPGHYGLINFPSPVYHPLFFKDYLPKFLRMVCFFCGHPTRDWTQVTGKTPKRAIPQYLRLPELGCGPHALSCCPQCEAKAQPSYTRAGQNIVATWAPDVQFESTAEAEFARQEFTCKRAYEILDGMPAWFWQDVLKLTSHPKDVCILTSMLVPPTCIRPSVAKRNSTGEMDLTKMLCDIVKFSNQLREAMADGEEGGTKKPVKKASKPKAKAKAKGKGLRPGNSLGTGTGAGASAQAGTGASGEGGAGAHAGTGASGEGGAGAGAATGASGEAGAGAGSRAGASGESGAGAGANAGAGAGAGQGQEQDQERERAKEKDREEERRKEAATEIAKAYDRLQQAVNVYHDKDMHESSHPQRTVGPMKAKRGLIPRLAGKQGRFRKTLMGKRLNNCARCVITADPTIDLDQVRVPYEVAMKTSVPEIVNRLNRAELEECVRIGTSRLGGALCVTFLDGTRANLRGDGITSATERVLSRLTDGCIVHRMLRTGDRVLFNRQPTLSKTSIMGFDAIVDPLPGISTFRFNPASCKPFNADFDGDEMTIYIAQSLAARADLRYLAHLRCNLLSGADNRPILGCTQDSMSGIHLLTLESTAVPLDVFMDLAALQKFPKQSAADLVEKLWVRGERTGVPRSRLMVSGRRLVDLLLPPTTFYQVDGVCIRKGSIEPESAAFTSTHAGSGPSGLVATLCLDFGEGVAVEFLSDVSRMTTAFLTRYHGFSVSLTDLHMPAEVKRTLDREMAQCLKESREGQDEAAQVRALTYALDAGTEAVRGSRFMSPASGLGVMIRCGAKGTSLNARQMVACVGQQIIGDSRPRLRKGRTLSCFPFAGSASDPEARGFAARSYTRGLTAVQFVFHALAGRIGLVETACSTADSGYLQRKSSKWVENTIVATDGTVRALHQVLCFHALDGLSPHFLEKYVAADLLKPTTDPVVEPLRRELESVRRVQSADPDLALYIPFNVDRYLGRFETSKDRGPEGPGLEGPRSSSPCVSVAQLDQCVSVAQLDQCVSVAQLDQCVSVAQLDAALHAAFAGYEDLCLTQQKYHCFWALRKRRHLLTPARLREVCAVLEAKLARCVLQPGEPVGPESAQAINKNNTQMTLNSFHTVGVELKTGVPRIREVIEHVYALCYVVAQAADPAVASSELAVEAVARSLLPIYLKDVAARWSLVPQAQVPMSDLARAANNIPRPSLPAGSSTGPSARVPTSVPVPGPSGPGAPGGPGAVAKSGRGRKKKQAAGEALTADALCAVFHLDEAKMREHQLTVLGMLRHVKAQSGVRVTASGLYSEQGPTLTFHFAADTDAASALAAAKDAERLLLRGYAEVRAATVKPGAPSSSAGPTFEVHCLSTDLTPFALSHPALFNLSTLRCNNVSAVAELYGIEAALHALFCELKASVADGYVSSHHLYLFALHICNTGRLLAVTRHGMSKSGSDCLQRASFEQPKKVLANACLFGEQSKNVRRSVSTSTIIGSVPGIGTGTTFVYSRPGTDYRRTSGPAHSASGTAYSASGPFDTRSIKDGARPTTTDRSSFTTLPVRGTRGSLQADSPLLAAAKPASTHSGNLARGPSPGLRLGSVPGPVAGLAAGESPRCDELAQGPSGGRMQGQGQGPGQGPGPGPGQEHRQTWNCHRTGAAYLRDFYMLVAQHAGEAERVVDEAVEDLLTAARRHVTSASVEGQKPVVGEHHTPAGRGPADIIGLQHPRVQHPDVRPDRAADAGRKQSPAHSVVKRKAQIAADPVTDNDLAYVPLDFAL